ncbi:hypothetical protein, conserved in T. vivax [Trypanosoma vivax Y486]|uniref:Uncharacterized protein n=1 Tax=Trypanosoma vivax (strain Y486) TaxID=1055687 RepID=F9WVU8_TRYVY|nr:hypothetical protein, conserved in T. vivax [Trypanosoma vivax Y486]|eukprot:CCD21709.1 hypothetical protein, conserved in T. vivax [Trypanosoma vivax Y486]
MPSFRVRLPRASDRPPVLKAAAAAATSSRSLPLLVLCPQARRSRLHCAPGASASRASAARAAASSAASFLTLAVGAALLGEGGARQPRLRPPFAWVRDRVASKSPCVRLCAEPPSLSSRPFVFSLKPHLCRRRRAKDAQKRRAPSSLVGRTGTAHGAHHRRLCTWPCGSRRGAGPDCMRSATAAEPRPRRQSAETTRRTCRGISRPCTHAADRARATQAALRRRKRTRTRGPRTPPHRHQHGRRQGAARSCGPVKLGDAQSKEQATREAATRQRAWPRSPRQHARAAPRAAKIGGNSGEGVGAAEDAAEVGGGGEVRTVRARGVAGTNRKHGREEARTRGGGVEKVHGARTQGRER